MNLLSRPASWLLMVLLASPFTAPASEVDDIVPGHWVDLRGATVEDGTFLVQRLDLIDPLTEEVLIGTVSTPSDPGGFILLGQPVQVSAKTIFSKVSPTKLRNKRVKVEGHFRGVKRFSARKVSARGPGRDHISGLVSDIKKTPDGHLITVMNQRVRLPAGVDFRHEKPVSEYAITSIGLALPQVKQVSEDDQFGEGFRLGDRLLFTTLIEGRYTGEDNYDLDDRRPLDFHSKAASARGRFILAPGEHGISGQLEFRYARIWADDDLLGNFAVDDSRLGESFIYFDDPFAVDFDIQAGRLDFDDRREWLYDQNLDGLRVFWNVSGWLAELSLTTTFSDGSPRDENTYNYMAYISNIDRRFAAYVIHRDTDLPGLREKITHLGLRAFVEWPIQHETWLELAHVDGSRNDSRLGAWAMDVGTTRSIGRSWYLTAAWAFGQGDDQPGNGTDGNFRQTQMQDNNGKFGGVTSFRYYGELVDPELANMHIGTLGIGYRFTAKSSIDLVGHYYTQDKAVRRIIDSDLDQRPNGIDRELGWEIDAVIGWRPVRSWDFEMVIGRFTPGQAFRIRDDAWISKLQIRYRY